MYYVNAFVLNCSFFSFHSKFRLPKSNRFNFQPVCTEIEIGIIKSEFFGVGWINDDHHKNADMALFGFDSSSPFCLSENK